MGDGPFRDNSCSSRVRALPPGPHALGVLGYHEGAKRVLSCSENGKIIGIEVGWNVPDGKDNSMYTERFVSEVRILCSSGKIDLSFGSKELNLRKVNDSISFGATMHNATDKMRAQCSEDGSSSVTGLAWRETQKRNAGAARISGLTVLCSSGEVAHSKHSVFLPAGEDATAMKEHDRSFLCRDLTDASTLSKLAIWFHARSMAGIDFLECKVDPSTIG